jgi:hypothetical protein
MTTTGERIKSISSSLAMKPWLSWFRTYRAGYLLAFCMIIGCGKARTPTYPVSGTIQFGDGLPVRFGMVEFIPEAEGPSARGKIDATGRFVLGTFEASDGAVAGRHQVIVVQHITSDIAPPADHAHKSDAEEPSAMVDLRYSQLETSPLSATVEEGPNEVRLRVQRSASRVMHR